MHTPAAVLLDVYETVLSCDFDRHVRGLADAAGVDFDRWSTALELFVPALVHGRMAIGDAFMQVLGGCGVPSARARADELVERDAELIVECTTLFPDVLPAIEHWRAGGVTVALVSNCVANTRPLLDALGLSDAVDHVVLSCEVGSSKPDRRLYLDTAAAAGVAPEQALFVDDQERFCAGAEAVGMRAVLIDRAAASTARAGSRQSIRSLTDLQPGLRWQALG